MTIEQALENYRKGFPAIEIVSAATPDNGGIKRLSAEEQDEAVGRSDGFSGTLTKFVPASGAATRMFKDIFAAAQELEKAVRTEGGCYDNLSDNPSNNLSDNLSGAALSTAVALAENCARFPIDFPERLSTESDVADSNSVNSPVGGSGICGGCREPGQSQSAQSQSGQSLIERGAEIIRALVDADGLNLASKPKGLIPFHRYLNASPCKCLGIDASTDVGTDTGTDYGTDTETDCGSDSGKDYCTNARYSGLKDSASLSFTRTSFEEHLVEGAMYAKDRDGVVRIEFTVSPEHIDGFRSLFDSVKDIYEKEYHCRYDVCFSVQSPETDVVAVDMGNRPFVKENGELLLRPGGHGALIRNLEKVESDFVFLKNIDNVVKEERLPETVRWKKILLGRAVMLRERCRKALCDLAVSLAAHPETDCLIARQIGSRSSSVSDCCYGRQEFPALSDAVAAAEKLLQEEFSVRISGTIPEAERARVLIAKLNRPIRVCGMVRNEGEPGGGPFVCRDRDGATSLQILESVQVDRTLYGDELKNSTHFNPVDLVCSLKDFAGNKFDLSEYTDPEAGFITVKSYKGRDIKAQELPGLWNGAMSDWNTQFVEVPLSTFNPVKAFFDLLRPAHQ